MEPIREALSHDTSRAAWGELIVQNGRLSGAGRVLDTNLILIGSAEHCEIRLNAAGIAPLHCILAQTREGAALRDCVHNGGLLVDGSPELPALLHDGALITVGPFRFRLHLHADSSLRAEPTVADACDSESEEPAEVFRIQAAAVVAQQAALNEEEVRLQQQRLALEQQEAQLAAHLEEKRRRLVELRNQVKQARTELHDEREGQQREHAEAVQKLASLQSEVAEGRAQIQTERRRLMGLRRRLRQRLHRHWMAERATMRRREEALAAERRDLQKEAEQQEQESQKLFRDRLRFQSDSELGKRQLQDGWNQLHDERCRWEAQRHQEAEEVRTRGRELEQRAIDATDAESELASQRRRWEESRIHLEKETEGLEARIRNQRRKLADIALAPEDDNSGAMPTALRGHVEGGEAPIPTQSRGHGTQSDPEIQQRLASLERLAGELADQRLYLAEQCQRLNQVRKQWQEERDAAVAALEPLAAKLQEREQQIAERERDLVTHEEEHRRLREELIQQRHHLDAWQARLAVRSALWEAERDRLLVEVQQREELVEQQLAGLIHLRERWQQADVEGRQRLEEMLSVCEQLRQDCSQMRDEWLTRSAALEQDRLTLAERTLAAEEYRFAFLRQQRDQALVEERLNNLRERWQQEFQAIARPVMEEREQLASEAGRMKEYYANLCRHVATVHALEQDLTRQELEREQSRQETEKERATLQKDVQRLASLREVNERQVCELTLEVERLARALIEEGGDSEQSLPLAA